jgi:hypothetical protein
MAEEYRVGVFALLCIVVVGSVIGLLHGPIWYAVGPRLSMQLTSSRLESVG